MKYLIAFALIAVAVAMPEPIRLLEPTPVDIAPLVVPQEVMDDIALKVKVVDAPEVAEDANAYAANFVDEPANDDVAPAIEAEAYAVNFVDEPANDDDAPAIEAEASAVNFVDEAVNADVAHAIGAEAYAVNVVDEAANADVAPAIEAEASAVNFVDEAVNSEDAPAIEDASAYAVNFVDEAVNAEAPVVNAEDVSAYAVNFVDEAVNVEIPAAIKISEIPLPGSVVLPLDSIVPSIDAVRIMDAPADSSALLSPVKIVYVSDEETPSYMPIKQYPDPRWR